MEKLDKQAQLLEHGYCLFEGVLTEEMVSQLQHATDYLLAEQDPECLKSARTTGSMIPVMSGGPALANLIAWPEAIEALHELGFPHPTFSDGWIISKPPHSPRLFWHYDWFTWEDNRSYERVPPQVFLMYYLVDTTVENGALRVIPGSHVNHNPIHDLIGAPHSKELREAKETDSAEFTSRPDEVSVSVRAGDLIIGDARLLHAAHSNESDQRRTLITLWYQPDLASLPERMQAQMAKKAQKLPEHWPQESIEMVRPLMVHYEGSAEPYARSLYKPRAT